MSAFFHEMMRAGVYKRSQGRITRQVTFAALAVAFAVGAWRLSEELVSFDPGFRLGLSDAVFFGLLHYAVPGLLLAVGWWVSYRAVNLPSFADFLIAVEAEMNKVSWPSRSELIRASLVVLFTIIFLALVLYVYDVIWGFVFKHLGIF